MTQNLVIPENIVPSNWRWNFFSRDELKCKEIKDECRMDATFMDLLVALRAEFNKQLIISSGYRSPSYNNKVSFTGSNGPHTFGRAVDIYIGGQDAEELLRLVFSKFHYLNYPNGFTGKGIKQISGTKNKFLHLDNIPPNTTGFTRPITWSY